MKVSGYSCVMIHMVQGVAKKGWIELCFYPRHNAIDSQYFHFQPLHLSWTGSGLGSCQSVSIFVGLIFHTFHVLPRYKFGTCDYGGLGLATILLELWLGSCSAIIFTNCSHSSRSIVLPQVSHSSKHLCLFLIYWVGVFCYLTNNSGVLVMVVDRQEKIGTELYP